MNPNYNHNQFTNKQIPKNSNKSDHATHVWEKYILKSGFSKLLIIVHSAGGDCLKTI